MFKQTKSIFILVLIAIAGVICFQFLWLKQNYLLAEQQHKQQVNQALNSAIDQYFGLKTSKFTEDIQLDMNHRDSIGINSEDFSIGIDQSLLENASVIVKMDGQFYDSSSTLFKKAQKLNSETTTELIQSILPKIVGELMESKTDTTLIDSLFQLELTKQHLKGKAQITVLKENFDSKAIQSQSGAPIPVSHGVYLSTNISEHEYVILQQMWLPITGSFLLVSLLLFSFFITLNTISRQKRINEVKNDFINNMTHEFKTPLSSIYASVEAMLHFGALDDRTKAVKYLNLMQGELDRLSGLVQQILNAAVNDRKKINLTREEIDLSQLLNSIVARHRIASGKHLDFSFIQTTDFKLYADKQHFHNMLNNIIDNAIKYSGDPVNINVKLHIENAGLVLSINDNGIGMKKEYIDRIFDKFYRIPTGDRHDVKGFGLGLSYVYKIVQLHGWEISVTSIEHKGTTFSLLIPDEHE